MIFDIHCEINLCCSFEFPSQWIVGYLSKDETLKRIKNCLCNLYTFHYI